MRTFEPDLPLARGVTLIEASAGTGKTHGITGLFVRLVAEEGLEVDQVLVVTFTRAATAELRERVRGRLAEAEAACRAALAGEPPAEGDRAVRKLVLEGLETGSLAERARRLARARERFDEATISTIHGFCQRMLQQNAFESGAELDAELLEDPSALVEEVTDDYLSSRLAAAAPEWVRLVGATRCSRADLLALVRRIEAEPDCPVLPELPFGQGEALAYWEEERRRFLELWARRGRAEAESALAALKRRGYSVQPRQNATKLEACVRGLALPLPGALEGSARFACCLSARRLAAELGKAGIVPAEPLPAVFAAFDELVRAGSLVRSALKVELAGYARDELRRRKRERNVQTFGDVLRLLRDGLAAERALPPGEQALRRAIRAQFRAALIDEFQDTDQVQWETFGELFGDGRSWLYLIGDPKQAIYGFRGADLHAYLEARRAASVELTLPTNYRSDGRLVQALSHVFGGEGTFAEAGLEHVEVGVPPEHAADRLVFPDGPRPPLELVFVERGAEGSPGLRTDGFFSKTWLAGALPPLVARDVVELLRSGAEIVEDGASRPVRPSDIAVLTRKNSQAAALQRALLDRGVPAVRQGTASVLDSEEAVAVQRLLDAMVSPASSRAVAAALASPLLGLGANELAGPDEAALERWVERFHRWNETWLRSGVVAAFRRAFAESGARARLLSRRGGERALTNVAHLSELLHGAETADRLHPAGLADWLRACRAEPARRPEAAELRLESDDEAVQVVTVHRAKGLQYPIVLCPSLWDGALLLPAEHAQLRFHDRARGGRLALDLQSDSELPPKLGHLAEAAGERHAENIRLLYVALTRARHRLVVYWAAVEEGASSPLAFVLHRDRALPASEQRAALELDHAGWRDDSRPLARLRELAAGSRGTIGLELRRAPFPDAVHEPSRPRAARARARRFARAGFDQAYRRGSYTALVGAGSSRAGSGEQQAEAAEPETLDLAADGAGTRPASSVPAPPAGGLEVPLSRLPAGPGPGTAIHRVLERLEPGAVRGEGSLAGLVPAELVRAGLDPALAPAVVDGLALALASPLGGPLDRLSLDRVPRRDRLHELDFDLPVGGGRGAAGGVLTGRAIAGVFERHRPPDAVMDGSYPGRLAALAFAPLRGLLAGTIDLVFRAEVGGRERWFVADYKTNRLGAPPPAPSTTGDYLRPALLAQMARHHYYLQYHLYSVALHRYLRSRLGAAYDPDRDLGGVYYLFLRGMTGPGSPRDEDGQPPGVFFDRPGRELVEALSALLAAPAGGPR